MKIKAKKKTDLDIFLSVLKRWARYKSYVDSLNSPCMRTEYLLNAMDAETEIYKASQAALSADFLNGSKANGPRTDQWREQTLTGMYWGATGFPIIRPTSDLCDALIMTEAVGNLKDLKLPFQTLLVSIPKSHKLFFPGKGRVELLTISTTSYEERNQGLAVTALVGKMTYQMFWTLFDMPQEEAIQLANGDSDNGDVDLRLIFRLCLNIVEYLNNLSEEACDRETPSKGAFRGCSVNSIGGDVKLSKHLKEYARSYSADQKKLKNRHVRRGHFTNQPHGPKNSLRKRIWIHPVWVGPKLGEVIERGYKVS